MGWSGTSAEPRVLAVILNWRAADETSACAEAVLASRGVSPELLIVDNASGDGGARRLAARFGEHRVIALPENRGYAGGMNAGLERWLDRYPDEYALVLTQDARVLPDTIARLVAALDADGCAAAAGPLVYDVGSPDRLLSAGRVLHTRSARDRHLRAPRSGFPYAVDGIDGCCMLLRRRAVERLAGFDERYFMYWEETDFCHRARQRGWRVLVAPDAVVRHPGGPTARPHYYHYYMARNRLLFWRESHGIGAARVAAGMTADAMRAAASAALSALWPGRWPALPARLLHLGRKLRAGAAGVRDHIRGRYGRMERSDGGRDPAPITSSTSRRSRKRARRASPGASPDPSAGRGGSASSGRFDPRPRARGARGSCGSNDS